MRVFPVKKKQFMSLTQNTCRAAARHSGLLQLLLAETLVPLLLLSSICPCATVHLSGCQSRSKRSLSSFDSEGLTLKADVDVADFFFFFQLSNSSVAALEKSQHDVTSSVWPAIHRNEEKYST